MEFCGDKPSGAWNQDGKGIMAAKERREHKRDEFNREIGFPSPPRDGCPKSGGSLARNVVSKGRVETVTIALRPRPVTDWRAGMRANSINRGTIHF